MGCGAGELPRGSSETRAAAPCLGGEGAHSWVCRFEPHCWCPASQVGPAGAKSAYINTSEHALRGLCLPRHGPPASRLSLPLPEAQEQVGQGWGQTGQADLQNQPQTPVLSAPVRLAYVVPSVGTGSRLQR